MSIQKLENQLNLLILEGSNSALTIDDIKKISSKYERLLTTLKKQQKQQTSNDYELQAQHLIEFSEKELLKIFEKKVRQLLSESVKLSVGFGDAMNLFGEFKKLLTHLRRYQKLLKDYQPEIQQLIIDLEAELPELSYKTEKQKARNKGVRLKVRNYLPQINPSPQKVAQGTSPKRRYPALLPNVNIYEIVDFVANVFSSPHNRR